MKTYSVLPLLLLVLLLALGGCQPAAGPEPESTLAPTTPAPLPTETPLLLPATGPDIDSPAGVVEAFYTWYLDPGHEGDFRTSPYLSARRIQSLDQALQENPRLGADPFLLAQDTPGAIRVEPVSQDEETARVVLHELFNPGQDSEFNYDLTLDLIKSDDGWQIDQIQKGNPFTARGAVQLFYNWYYAEDDRRGGPNYAQREDGNPLSSRAYRNSPYLAPALIQEVDNLLENPGKSPYDPFLLARIHPLSVWEMPPAVETTERAIVPLQLSYGHQMVIIQVHVARQGRTWQIVEIAGDVPDETATAAQLVSLFYSRHFNLWYDFANRNDLPHTAETLDLTGFWQEHASFYQDDPLLSPSLAATVGQLPAGEGPLEDPFFQAAGIPLTVEVGEVQVDGNQATVTVTQRWNANHEIRLLTVTLEHGEDSQWQITAINLDETTAPPVPPEAALAPEEVLRTFFEEYLAGGGWHGGAAADSPYLSEGYVEALQQNDLSFYGEQGIPVEQYDPILYSAAEVLPLQEIRLEVEAVQVEEELHRATARVNRIYSATGTSLPLYVTLIRDWDQQWRIVEILPHSPDLEPAPAWQVGYLYSWAVAYARQQESVGELAELFRIPVADGEGLHFCSDSWPQGIAVDGVFVEPAAAEEQRAWVVVRTSARHHLFTVEMVGEGTAWQIVDQHCGDTAANRALAFYTWYLGYSGDALQEQIYASGDYLSAALSLAVDEMRASAGDSQYDPFVQSELRPELFRVEPGPTDDTTLVHLSFPDGTTRTLHLAFVPADGHWLLSNISGSGE